MQHFLIGDAANIGQDTIVRDLWVLRIIPERKAQGGAIYSLMGQLELMGKSDIEGRPRGRGIEKSGGPQGLGIERFAGQGQGSPTTRPKKNLMESGTREDEGKVYA